MTITTLPAELQLLIFKRIPLKDLLEFSLTNREMRRFVLSMFACDTCGETEGIAFCSWDTDCCGCERFFCEQCYPDHYAYAMDEFSYGAMECKVNILPTVKNKVFSFTVEYLPKESEDDDDDDDDDDEIDENEQ